MNDQEQLEFINQICEECRRIIDTCSSCNSDRNQSTCNNQTPMHYRVQILKLQPTKVLINGKIKDRSALSANERAAVKAQEEIDRARKILYSQNKQKIQNNLL